VKGLPPWVGSRRGVPSRSELPRLSRSSSSASQSSPGSPGPLYGSERKPRGGFPFVQWRYEELLG
jgi:hypothetical protein